MSDNVIPLLPRPRPARFDVLRTPLLGRFLRWKHSRTLLQSVLFAAAALMIVDGLVGSQLPNKNTATVGAWVHYRGFVALALLVAGNLFCAACPFVLPRKLAKWLGRPERRWPKTLRNKWLALACFVGIIFAYELFDLWASPWWTAWLIVAYFVLAFLLEAFFTRNSFCLYVCPLGTFNFLYSTVSPLQISARDRDVCRSCPGHECINGSATQQGCQLELYVPTLRSNMDCTLCLDCVKACPYDNVALTARPPGDELFRQSWPRRLDLALLSVVAAATALLNAFAMTPPGYALEEWLAAALGTRQEWIVLGLLFLVGAVAGPVALALGAAWLSRAAGGTGGSLREALLRGAYAFVPLGFAVWTAHYLFHFLTGAFTLLPALQIFLAETVGLALLGEPNWELAARLTPSLPAIQVVQLAIVALGLAWGGAVARRGARRSAPVRAWASAAPWLVLLALLALGAAATFLLPMEMRGSVLMG